MLFHIYHICNLNSYRVFVIFRQVKADAYLLYEYLKFGSVSVGSPRRAFTGLVIAPINMKSTLGMEPGGWAHNFASSIIL